jgi:hypothetical protein
MITREPHDRDDGYPAELWVDLEHEAGAKHES